MSVGALLSKYHKALQQLGKNPFIVLICWGRGRAVPNLDANRLFQANLRPLRSRGAAISSASAFLCPYGVSIHFWGSVHLLPRWAAATLSSDVGGRRRRAVCVGSDSPAAVQWLESNVYISGEGRRALEWNF